MNLVVPMVECSEVEIEKRVEKFVRVDELFFGGGGEGVESRFASFPAPFSLFPLPAGFRPRLVLSLTLTMLLVTTCRR